VQYYGRFNKSVLYSALRSLDGSLMRWAQRKYKQVQRASPARVGLAKPASRQAAKPICTLGLRING